MTLSVFAVRPVTLVFGMVLALGLSSLAQAGEALIEPFVGEYAGSASLDNADGSTTPRDMSVSISETKDGFNVSWTSTTHKPDGRIKEKSYSIDFLPTDRDGIYSAAMERNVFGHAVQLDPMKGEPFVWGRITGDVLTVFSLFVDDQGGYEMQQFDRRLADGGLDLEFSRLRDGEPMRSVSTFLEKQ
ncbi:hypothetical protein [Primorskyibacter sp. S87]|uniref:hypothetical protein n=1 Tax=Primorskyibacter sp. S87 TaxID=3415126 RepID=UPI003C7CDAF6